TTFTYIYLPFNPVNFSAVSWGDFDADGLLDFVVSGDPIGWDPPNTFTALYHYTGNDVFELVPTNLPYLNGSAVAWGDYDNDGDLDLAMNGWHDDSTNMTRIFRNDGAGVFTDINAGLINTWWGSVEWGDVDNDGRLDLLISGGSAPQPFAAFYNQGGQWGPLMPVTLIYHNNSPQSNARPSEPEVVSSNIAGTAVTFTWGEGADDRTPQSMITYNLRVGTSPGAGDVVLPAANISTGYSRIPQSGNNNHKRSRTIQLPEGVYYWSVQSVDNSYAGSPFSAEGVVGSAQGPQWQLISLPFTHPDQHRTALFPDAISNAFGFHEPTGYAIADLLENGSGYWLKFQTPDFPTPSSGGNIPSLGVPVTQGWNLIGAISQSIPAAQVASQPPGMVTSQFFGYKGNYASSQNIEPGKGYWVKVNQSGNLILSSSSGMESIAERIRIVPTEEMPPSPPGPNTPAQGPAPSRYTLAQNYPNPFNPSTEVRFGVMSLGFVSLKVFDVLGREVARIVNEERQPGEYTERWDASGMPSGVYYYRLRAGAYSETRRMLLVR
ncbi:MAG TPA: FG-GAP-like repeat-containing protein, partial [Bacteroidota bacterium]|nr:FG-GAP-like repeat-containing protein [Bacteroidota bacterium]